MEKNLVLVTDFDGVLFTEHAIEPFTLFLSEVTGKPFDWEVFNKTHDYRLASGIAQEDLAEQFIRFHEVHPEVDEACAPIPGAQGAVDALAPRGEIHVVTARDSRLQERVNQRLHNHFGIEKFKSQTFNLVYDKVAQVKEFGGNVFIDDSYFQVQAVAEKTDAQTIFFPHLKSLKHLEQRHRRIIYPKNVHELSPEMTVDQLATFHEQVWQEITDLCHQLVEDRAKAKATRIAV